MLENLLQFEKQVAEEEAEALEAYRKGTGEAPVLYKATGHYKATEGGVPLFVANEESEDRMGDIIEVKGWQLDNFEANPVILFQHRHDVAPIGTAPRVFKQGNALMNTVGFDIEDPFAALIAGKVQRGVMRAESVGFRVLEFEAKEPGDGQQPDPWRDGFRFTKSELLEISIVSVPAHPKALRKAMGDLDKGQFYIVVPEVVELTVPSSTTATAGAGAAMVATKTLQPVTKDSTDPEPPDGYEMDWEATARAGVYTFREVATPEPVPEPEEGLADSDAVAIRNAIAQITFVED